MRTKKCSFLDFWLLLTYLFILIQCDFLMTPLEINNNRIIVTTEGNGLTIPSSDTVFLSSRLMIAANAYNGNRFNGWVLSAGNALIEDITSSTTFLNVMNPVNEVIRVKAVFEEGVERTLRHSVKSDTFNFTKDYYEISPENGIRFKYDAPFQGVCSLRIGSLDEPFNVTAELFDTVSSYSSGSVDSLKVVAKGPTPLTVAFSTIVDCSYYFIVKTGSNNSKKDFILDYSFTGSDIVTGLYSENASEMFILGNQTNIGVYSGHGDLDYDPDSLIYIRKDSICIEGGQSMKATARTDWWEDEFTGWYIIWGGPDSTDMTYRDMSQFTGGEITFYVKSPHKLEIGIRSIDVPAGKETSKIVIDSVVGNKWKKIILPIDVFCGRAPKANLAKMKVLFNVALNNDTYDTNGKPIDFWIDDIRWIRRYK